MGDSWACDVHADDMVNLLPGEKVADATNCLDSLVDGAVEQSVVKVYLGTSDMGKCCCEVLEAKFSW